MSSFDPNRLAELEVDAQRRNSWGLPSDVFVLVVGLSFLYGVMLAWWFGLLLFVILFAPLYRAHQTDPSALSVWMRVFFRRVYAIDPTLDQYDSVRFQ